MTGFSIVGQFRLPVTASAPAESWLLLVGSMSFTGLRLIHFPKFIGLGYPGKLVTYVGCGSDGCFAAVRCQADWPWPPSPLQHKGKFDNYNCSIMARKGSLSDFAYALFRAGLTAYLIDAQSRSAPSMAGPLPAWQMTPEKVKEVEIELFPDQSTRVQRFRTQQQAATRSGFKSPHPGIKIKKEHRERARIDYENARGSIHRRLLLDTEPHLQTKAREAHKRVMALEDEVNWLESAREAELRWAVTRPLVARELPTLPGIGWRLADAIQAQVFNGDLDSLRMAYIIEGIGPQKQATINAWIDQRTMLLSGLLNGAFPEKAGIVARYDQELSAKQSNLSKAKAHEKECRDVLEKVYDELDWLMTVTWGDFELTYGNSDAAHEQITRYLLGVFPPWEPMPDWFARALEASGETDHLTASQTANFTRPARA